MAFLFFPLHSSWEADLGFTLNCVLSLYNFTLPSWLLCFNFRAQEQLNNRAHVSIHKL